MQLWVFNYLIINYWINKNIIFVPRVSCTWSLKKHYFCNIYLCELSSLAVFLNNNSFNLNSVLCSLAPIAQSTVYIVSFSEPFKFIVQGQKKKKKQVTPQSQPSSDPNSPGFGQGSPGFGQGSPGFGQGSPGFGQGSPGFGQGSPQSFPDQDNMGEQTGSGRYCTWWSGSVEVFFLCVWFVTSLCQFMRLGLHEDIHFGW